MPESPHVRLSYRSAENTLRLTLDDELGESVIDHEVNGYLDIAEKGRLVGIELTSNGLNLTETFSTWLRDKVASNYLQVDDDSAYVALSAPQEDIPSHHVRTAEVRLHAELDADAHLVALAIPRRGHGYEISFPSGNR
jgi:hypothetical protein